jgi:hypothetical protein
VAGDDDRAHVSQTFLQPFLSYTTKTYTTFSLNTESTYDWNATKWTTPINATVQQLLKITSSRSRSSSARSGTRQARPRAPDWGIRFAVTLLFPKK